MLAVPANECIANESSQPGGFSPASDLGRRSVLRRTVGSRWRHFRRQTTPHCASAALRPPKPPTEPPPTKRKPLRRLRFRLRRSRRRCLCDSLARLFMYAVYVHVSCTEGLQKAVCILHLQFSYIPYDRSKNRTPYNVGTARTSLLRSAICGGTLTILMYPPWK